MLRPSIVLVAAFSLGCSSAPSPRWQQGGAHIPLGTAYWRDDDQLVELRANGEVREEDQVLFKIDASGRVSSATGEPLAVLLPDGQLIAEDDARLGWVGGGSALHADGKTRSVYLFPTGQAFIADEDGEWANAGQWAGCEHPMLWTCTLITHVFSATRRRHRGSGSSGARNVLELLQLLKLLH